MTVITQFVIPIGPILAFEKIMHQGGVKIEIKKTAGLDSCQML